MKKLRSESLIAATQCAAGARIWLDLEEMKLHGWATVESISPCPPIANGPGRVVLSTYRHLNSEVRYLGLRADDSSANQTTLLKPTASHPIYSVTQQDWVAAGDLKVGESVQTRGGQLLVASNTPASGTQPVFNLEVEGEHEYFTGELEVRSHNSCQLTGKISPAKNPLASDGLPKGGTYTLLDGDGKVVRTGRSKDLDKRKRQHDKENPGYRFKKEHRTNDYNEQRGLEEKLYNDNPQAKHENGGLNRIKPIREGNPKADGLGGYRDAANNFTPPQPITG